MPAPSSRSRDPSKPATRDEIAHLVGDVEDATVAAIEATGATYREVDEAARWAAGDAERLGKAGRTLSAMAHAVYNILLSEPSFGPPARER